MDIVCVEEMGFASEKEENALETPENKRQQISG
jgi:hypothetical protein